MKISAAVIALSKIAPLAQAKQPELSATPVRNNTPAPPGFVDHYRSWRVSPVFAPVLSWISRCPNFESDTHIHVMPHLDTCLGILRRLIAKGDPNGIPLAERAINEYWDVTPAKARKSGFRLIQQAGSTMLWLEFQRSFAETVNAYIEKKLAEQ